MSATELGRTERTRATKVPVELSGGPGKASFGVAVGGALLGSVCCLLPAVALAVGFGGAAGLVQLGRYQPYLLGASILFVGAFNWHLLRRREHCCTTPEPRSQKVTVTYDPAKTNPEAIKRGLEAGGDTVLLAQD